MSRIAYILTLSLMLILAGCSDKPATSSGGVSFQAQDISNVLRICHVSNNGPDWGFVHDVPINAFGGHEKHGDCKYGPRPEDSVTGCPCLTEREEGSEFCANLEVDPAPLPCEIPSPI